MPESMAPPEPGTRVRVPFGERVLTGVVMGPAAAGDPAGRRDLIESLDLEPACPAELLAIASRVAERFFVSTGEILRSALPARLPAAGAVRYRLTERGALARGAGAEQEILQRLSGGESVRVTDLAGPGRQESLRSLEERGWIRPVTHYRQRRRRFELAYTPARTEPAQRARSLGRSPKAAQALAYLESLGRPATAREIRAG
ncbi:MAG TPA: hypothetical protein VMR54_10495, partial [Thermoanaerobaculia bacterium]|nr:hypothetical protein [Thermoanaerobaculia bacterium]